MSLPVLTAPLPSDPSAAWTTISQCASVLESIRTDESHLVLLKNPPSVLFRLFSDSADAAQSELLARAQNRLDEIKRTVGTKRATNATSAAAVERENVRTELVQHGLLFDFPIVEEGERELGTDNS